ncbi:MmcQ/YjbR family DNA-binding protein [Fusobacterium hwasookii]|uniref:Cytoplasmic protein n=1 Tax=Fusobacterium hwasookii ChDC F128 TaxID=1216362 RepID=A0ABP2R4M0_9FUSO|nr:MmcQ/YjbR family DNA-binding protein [Fusobacterium hwasookii]EJU07830.1 cytoplasmic protein [Fusobacterium hwasookii ChDC F128]QNE67287.1 MmcQ/YjbR family DNA-binding protein [Fusobacterium hwasookii]
MRELKDFIKDKKIDLKRLKKFGFKLKDNSYYYHTSLLKNQFKMSVKISLDNSIFTEIIDVETNEPYVLHLLEMKRSGYSEKVYKAYNKVLEKIQKECFEDERFKANYTKEIIDYINNKYGDKLEFLWEKSPKNAVVRRKSTKKWYAAMLTISKRKIGLNSDELVEIINLHNSQEEIEKLIDNKKYFPAYHMNKKHWCTICLDGTVELKEIYKLIDISYELAK